MEKQTSDSKSEKKKQQKRSDDSNSYTTYYDKAPKLTQDAPSKLRKQFSKGLGYFLIIAACIVFYFLFLRMAEFFTGFSTIIGILRPILYGLVIAYLLNPVVKKVEKFCIVILSRYKFAKLNVQKISRVIGIICAQFLMMVIVVLLINMIIPEVIKSIETVIVTLPNQINDWVNYVSNLTIANNNLANFVESALHEGAIYLRQWIQSDLMDKVNEVMTDLTGGVIAAVQGVFNIIMGIIVSIYVLLSKEVFLGQCKKAIYAILPARNANVTLHIAKKSNQIFGGFVIGKLIDSIIIGLISFICLTIINMPYALLVSVIVGATNIIPFFGPFIGAIPSAFLIFLQDPIQGVYFIIFILILQQVDGNIIGPKILGDSTGLSSFWVITAILLGGGLFGFVGMVVGVPTFAVIYYIVGLSINQRLERKSLPTNTEEYDELSYVDTETGKFMHLTRKINKEDEADCE